MKSRRPWTLACWRPARHMMMKVWGITTSACWVRRQVVRLLNTRLSPSALPGAGALRDLKNCPVGPGWPKKSRLLAPRGGIGVLTRKLDSLLPVQNNTTVRYVTPADSRGRHTIHYLKREPERRSVTPDVVVCAVEGKYLDRLVQGMTPKQEALARNCFFTKEPIVCWIVDEKHAPKEYAGGGYIPDHTDPMKAKTTYWLPHRGTRSSIIRRTCATPCRDGTHRNGSEAIWPSRISAGP